MTDLFALNEPEDVGLADALAERYLTYALSTIVSRSLPDARDGLKPVHRRLLYAMRQLRLDPASGFKKCARVVGDVIGKFHPHGDAAVYDALVRLAQEFALRYPLVEGHGNFGNVDGDGAAAMRYTEARLTYVAEAMLDGIDEDAVDLRPTYDGEDEEPVVLPAAFPNLLANGATGIAVGMATSIPPHNVAEVCAALLQLISQPEADSDLLLALVPGPDFPTGGVLVDAPATIAEAYRTGRGVLRLRARWHEEKTKGSQTRIVVTEVPYQVPKARLIEQIAEVLENRKAPFAAEVRDESTADIRIVLAVKDRTQQPAAVMDYLFAHTELQVRVVLNMNALADGKAPRLLNLRDMLRIFLDHRFEVLKRRARFRLARLERRLEVLAGLRIALLNIDEVIRIIREADEPKRELMRRFTLSDTQAEAILNMRLRQLHKLEALAVEREHAEVATQQADLQALLADDGRCWAAIAAEIDAVARQFGAGTPLGRRRTTIEPITDAAPALAAFRPPAEPITVVCSARGWVRVLRGGVADPAAVRYKEGDGERFLVAAESSDRLLLTASNGRFYTLACDRLPAGRGFGEPLRLMLDIDDGHEPVALCVHRPGRRLLVASDSGRGFLVDEDATVASTRRGKAVFDLEDGERVTACIAVEADDDMVAIVGSNRKLLVFPLPEVPVLARGKGVILQRYRAGHLADVRVFRRTDGLTWRSGRGVRCETNLDLWLGRRGQGGRSVPRGFPASNRFG